MRKSLVIGIISAVLVAPAFAIAPEEYWIVQGLKRTIELYRKPVDGRYAERRTFRCGEMLRSFALPGLARRVEALYLQRW